MDTQKEIELFEELLIANPDFDASLLAKDEDGNYEDCEISDLLGIFQAGIEIAEREARMNAKAQAVPEVITIGNELQSWVAVNSFSADDGEGVLPVVDANAIAEKIEELTGANQ